MAKTIDEKEIVVVSVVVSVVIFVHKYRTECAKTSTNTSHLSTSRWAQNAKQSPGHGAPAHAPDDYTRAFPAADAVAQIAPRQSVPASLIWLGDRRDSVYIG